MDAGSSGKISSASEGWYGPTVDVMFVQSRSEGQNVYNVWCSCIADRVKWTRRKDDEILPRSEMSAGPVEIEAGSI
jgi:hypothetical protein